MYILRKEENRDTIKNNIAMSNAQISCVESYLTKDNILYEYGSGGSTLWFAPLVKKMYSVEHVDEWYNKLTPHLHENTDLQLHTPHSPTEYPEFTDELVNKLMGDQAPRGNSNIHWNQFVNYIRSIDRVTEPIDRLIVDGRHRVLCAYYAHRFITDDAVIFFDDWNRSAYHGILHYYDLVTVINKIDESTGYPEFEDYPNGERWGKMFAVLKKKV